MIYKSGKVGCYDAYDYVKNNLSKIGNIKAFKAFFEDTIRYSEDVNGRKEFYNFILFNENGDEFWIDSNCGYPGCFISYN